MTEWILGLILAGVAALFTIIVTVSAFRTADRLAPESVLDGTGASGIDKPLSTPRAGAMRKLATTGVIFAIGTFFVFIFPERSMSSFTTWTAILVPFAAFVFMFLLSLVWASKFGPNGRSNSGMRGLAFLTSLMLLAVSALALLPSLGH